MGRSGDDAADFFVTGEAARAATLRLAETTIHPQFSGYLAVVAAASKAGTPTSLRVNFSAFYNEYLLVADAPEDRPYLHPFTRGKGLPVLFNANVAGSYAPSSLRDVAPIKRVVDFTGSRNQVEHSLKPNHEQLAREALTGSRKVPAHSLATFLLRDHGIQLLDPLDPVESALHAFARLLGYDLADKNEARRFEELYSKDRDTFTRVSYANFITE